MSKALTSTEKEARALMKKYRKILIQQIEDYDDPEKFPVEDARRAIMHSYSILSRFEREYQDVPSPDYYEDIMEELEKGLVQDGGTVEITEKAHKKLVKALEREKSRSKRVDVLKEMAKANRLLAQQMTEHQKVEESKAKQRYIEVAHHAQVLAAYNDMIFLTLRRIGLSELEMREFFSVLERLKGDYPLVAQDFEDIVAKLTASPEERVNIKSASYEVIDDPTDVISEVEETL